MTVRHVVILRPVKAQAHGLLTVPAKADAAQVAHALKVLHAMPAVPVQPMPLARTAVAPATQRAAPPHHAPRYSESNTSRRYIFDIRL